MCLDKIDKKITTKKGTGYKIFRGPNGDNKIIKPQYRADNLRIGVWLKDKHKGRIRADDGNLYKKGFHLYQHKRAPKVEVGNYHYLEVRKVKYRKVVATGKQNGKVIVAREIKILEVV